MTTTEITIDRIFLAEPDLMPIIEEAKRARVRAQGDDQMNIWLDYGRLKKEASKIVGWHAVNIDESRPWLYTDIAYNVTIRALSDALGV